MSKLMLKNCRLSFPSLFEHATYQGQDLGRYEATFLIPKDSDDAKAVQAAIKEVGKEVLGDSWSKAKLCILDGDDKDYSGYPGNWAVKASTKKRPIVIDKDKSALTAEDDKPYAGSYVNASISIYSYQNNYGKFVQAQLNAVQFAKDGEAFGGGDSFSVDEFDDVSDGDDASDDDTPF